MTYEGPWHGSVDQAKNVARGALAMAMWGLEVGIMPTKEVEDEIANCIRGTPHWLREFQEGTPDEAAAVVRRACEAWQMLTEQRRR